MPEPSTLEVLTSARALLAKGWTKWVYARDHSGLRVGFRSEAAVCFCTSGALAKAADISSITDTFGNTNDYAMAKNAIKAEIGPKSIPQWNDAPERTQAEVLEVFDRAIAKLAHTPHTNNPTESN